MLNHLNFLFHTENEAIYWFTDDESASFNLCHEVSGLVKLTEAFTCKLTTKQKTKTTVWYPNTKTNTTVCYWTRKLYPLKTRENRYRHYKRVLVFFSREQKQTWPVELVILVPVWGKSLDKIAFGIKAILKCKHYYRNFLNKALWFTCW